MGPAIFTTKKKKSKKNDKFGESFHSSDYDNKQEPTTSETNSEAVVTEAGENQKTVFSVRAFPIGGYVSMAGEDEASTDKNAFCNKPVWQRFIITFAGAAMNILLGFLCMCILVGIDSANGALSSTTVAEFCVYEENQTPIFSEPISNKCESPLMVGDTIIKIDGTKVYTGSEVVYEIMNKGYEPIDLIIKRNGETITLENVTFPVIEESGVKFGHIDFKVYAENSDFGTIARHALHRSVSTVKMITDSIKDLLTGRYGAEAVSGPIGMAGAVENAANTGFSSVLFLFTLITINLGVFNLLPFPALDGGRIIFLAIEGIIKRPVKKEFEQAVNTVGIMLLMAIMLFITLKDIVNLF
jgi:regulator of sigma E protease